MQLIILAAGQGSRLSPYTDDRPKTMVEVLGKPIIEHILDSMRPLAFNQKIIVTGYKKEKLQYLIESEKMLEVYNPLYASSNMAYSLSLVLDKILSNRVLISYSDTVFSPEIVQGLTQTSADIAVAADLRWYDYWKKRIENPLDDAESFKMDRQKNILELGKKTKTLSDIEAQYTGLLFFQNEGVNALKKELKEFAQQKNAYMTDFFQNLINNKINVKAFLFNEDWVEVDSVSDLQNEETINRIRTISEKSNRNH